MPADLAAFLAERLDEAEQNISYAGPARIAWLSINDDAGEFRYTTVAAGDDNSPWCADGRELPEPASVRVVWDPARELRAIAAKRRILELSDDADWLDKTLDGEIARTPEPEETTLGEELRRAIATEWDDHPAYLPEWAPEPATAP